MRKYKEFGAAEEGVVYVERLGSYGIAIHDDTVLIEIAEQGYFLPGGKAEVGEHAEQTLRREFLEETGYEIVHATHVSSSVEYARRPDGAPVKKINTFYLVELGAKGEPSYADGHVYPVEWIPKESIQEHMHLDSQWWALESALSQGKTGLDS